MLIEKRFFDIAKREDEEIKRELEAEKAKMTEEEKLEEKNRHEAEVKELIRKAEARMKKHKKIPDSKKIVEFTLLQKAALEIAEHMGMNIKTEQKKDDLWGTIELAFDKMWFLDSNPPEWVDVWNSLLTEAHSVYIEIKDNIAVINGVDKLHCANVHATDLRGGAALVVAALCASGESNIYSIEHIDRGYENLENALSSIGADIKRSKNEGATKEKTVKKEYE